MTLHAEKLHAKTFFPQQISPKDNKTLSLHSRPAEGAASVSMQVQLAIS